MFKRTCKAAHPDILSAQFPFILLERSPWFPLIAVDYTFAQKNLYKFWMLLQSDKLELL